jgi:hypothetical protein
MAARRESDVVIRTSNAGLVKLNCAQHSRKSAGLDKAQSGYAFYLFKPPVFCIDLLHGR